ncbi:MPPV-279 conserved hypothetical protein [Magpiepox virus 2]|nr:conserved hypothetical protein [Magpiepox virus]QZW33602.1 MPPV-279 conserved hypothetical protein [Magpiepox virus 2]
MEIFELISNRERYFSSVSLVFPKKKKVYDYKNVKFIFFSPSDKKIDYYMCRCDLHYTDFVVYGEVIIDDMIMLLIYLDFKYYGITEEGKTKYLGNTIKDLRIRETKQWKDFSY